MKFLALAFLVLSSSAFAAPSNFVLRAPTKVAKNADGGIDVHYTARCSSSDWASVVSAYDDSGDQVSVIGIAVPMDSRSCKPSKGYQEFSVRVSKGEQAYDALTGEFEPMVVLDRNR